MCASPQKENGFTAIANELLEKIYYLPISGSEFRILLMVIRKTYGFNKKEDRISLSQFAKGIGLKRPNVCNILKSLLVKRLLLKGKNGYKLNKNYDEWVVVKRLPPVVKRLTAGGSQTTTHKRQYTKDTLHINMGTSPKIKFQWQDEALEAIKFFKDGKQLRSRIFKCFKDNTTKAKIAFNDCKELSRYNTMYFFAVYNKIK